MLEQELIRKAVEVKRVEAGTRLKRIKRFHEESQSLAVERIAKLLEPECADQESPQLTEAIRREQEWLSREEVYITTAQANLEFYEQLCNDSKAMQEFFDRHIGNQKEGAK